MPAYEDRYNVVLVSCTGFTSLCRDGLRENRSGCYLIDTWNYPPLPPRLPWGGEVFSTLWGSFG